VDLCKDGNWTNVQCTEARVFVKTTSGVLIASPTVKQYLLIPQKTDERDNPRQR
jgi:hypothetical protein